MTRMPFQQMLARRYSCPRAIWLPHCGADRSRDATALGNALAQRSPASIMQTYDFMMLVVIGGATLFGFWKGMAWQIASLASLVLSYFAALRFSSQLAPMFGNHAPWNRFVAMIAIYIGTSFIIWTLFRFVASAIDKVRLASFDRQLGAMFGLAKGVLLCVVITFFAVASLPPTQGEAIVSSQSGRYIVALLDKSHSVFPPEIHQIVDPYIFKIEQRLNSNNLHPGMQTTWPQPGPTQPSQPAWPPMNVTIPEAIKSQLPHIEWPSSGTQSPPPPADDPYRIPYSAGAAEGRGY